MLQRYIFFLNMARGLLATFPLSLLSVFINYLTQHLPDFMLQFMSRIIFPSDFILFPLRVLWKVHIGRSLFEAS